MNYPQIMLPVSFASKSGGHVPSSYRSAAHAPQSLLAPHIRHLLTLRASTINFTYSLSYLLTAIL